jgi:hypothetical protein
MLPPSEPLPLPPIWSPGPDTPEPKLPPELEQDPEDEDEGN